MVVDGSSLPRDSAMVETAVNDNNGWRSRGLTMTCPRCGIDRHVIETTIHGRITYYCGDCEHGWEPTEPKPGVAHGRSVSYPTR